MHGPTGKEYSSDPEGDGPKDPAPNVGKANQHIGGSDHGPTGKRYSSDSEGDGPKAEAMPGEVVEDFEQWNARLDQTRGYQPPPRPIDSRWSWQAGAHYPA